MICLTNYVEKMRNWDPTIWHKTPTNCNRPDIWESFEQAACGKPQFFKKGMKVAGAIAAIAMVGAAAYTFFGDKESKTNVIA